MNIDIKTADGEEIELGGAYYDGRGTEYKAVGVRLVDYRRIVNVSLSCLTGKSVSPRGRGCNRRPDRPPDVPRPC